MVHQSLEYRFHFASLFFDAGSVWERGTTEPADYILTAKVSDMLLAVPKYGHVKVNKILAQCRISPSKTIGGLSERQRRELIGHLIRR